MKLRNISFLGAGRNRAVFLLPSGFVIKVPLNDNGILDNWLEARRAKKDEWLLKDHKAKCRLWGVCLIMQYVKPYYGVDLPDWTAAVDCRQVGYTNQGKLVAYDFA